MFWTNGVNVINRTSLVISSRRGASNFWNVGWRMINDGSESPMVYNSSLTGWVVPNAKQ